METLPEWTIGVEDQLVTLRRRNWKPIKLSRRQAKEIIKGIDKAIEFIEVGPSFSPIHIG